MALKMTEMAHRIWGHSRSASPCRRAACAGPIHVGDGELANAKQPLVPGHEIVGHLSGFSRQTGEERRSDRDPLVGLDLRTLRILPARPRESVPECALHRLPA